MSSITQTQKEGSDNSEAQELLAKESTMASNRGSKVYRQNDFAKMDNAELIKTVSGLQARLTKIEDMNVDLRAELMKALDQRDLLHKKLNDESINDNGLKQVQDQMLHKDRRILELNNVILEKERKIIDLQEMCSEQGQVAHSKSLAMHIVNNRLRELDAKQMMDATTETDFKFSGETTAATTNRSRSPRRISPGRAIPQFKFGGNGSPPPVDPAEDCSSYTTETVNIDGELGKSKKYRKKVTFDVDGSEARATAFDKQMVGTSASRPSRREPVATANVDYEELLTENDHLRQIISEMEKNQRVENSKSASSQVLKAKAVAQTKIKELEGIIVQNKLATDEEIAELRSVIKQLNDSRDWVLDENAKLQEQLETAKIRCNDLYEELDASLKTTDVFRKRVDESAMKIDAIVSELYQSRAMVQQVSDEKAILASEIERLKEAIFAQDEFITLLEGDLIVYEAHVGILRDSLGASKKEDRQSIKSKAFTAKINALETEKQEIVKKNNEEKLRAKALAIKVRCLEEERDQLKMALRHYEKEFGTATKEAHGQQIVYDNNSQREQQTIERAERQMPSATMTKLSMESVVPDNFMEEKIREANLQNEALQAEKAELQEKLAQLSNRSMHLSGIVKSFFASISQQIDFGMNELDLDNDDGFEEFSNNFVLAESKFCELNAKMKSMGEREHSLLEQLSTLEQELATSKTNVTKLEEEKQKVELELREVQAECQRGVEKLRQNGQFIASLERRNADLAEEISQQNARLGALEERKTLLEEEKASLQQKLEAEIQNLETKSVDLEQQLRATKEERMALGLALTEKKKRLADLIEILTEIVDRFKGAGNSEVLSGDVLHDFLRQHIQPSNDSKSVGIEQESAPKSPNDEPIPLPIPEESIPPKVPTFSKAVSVQVNLSREEENTRRLADLQTTVDKQQNLIKSLEFQLEASRGEHAELGAQLSDLNQQKCELSAERNALLTQVTDQNEQLSMLQNSQQNFSEIQVQLEDLTQQKEVLEAERDDLLAKLAGHTQMLADLHEQYRHKIIELSDQLTALHQTIGAFEQQQEQQLKKTSSNADSGTQTEPAPGGQAMVNQQTQMSCPEKMHAEIQMDPVEMKSAAVQTEEAEAKAEQLASDELLALISNRNEEEAERESAAEVAMVRQQSRQLLMDCIQDREQFERHLGDNVQQLVELKSELESSVDVLRGEIWSLNQELKKRFDERNSLATRLEQMDLLLAESGERSAQLVNAIGEKDAELAQLRRDLDGAAEDKLKMEAQIMELHSLGEEKTRKAESLEKLAVALNSLMRENVREWRNELEQLKALQVECCGQLLERTLQSISTSTDQIARCTAARLTTKTQDNERLLRENTELIQTNVRLAKELEEAAADGERKTKSGHQPRLDLDAQMEMAAEAETRVEMQIMKKECGREEANILVAIDQKESLEADIGVEDAGKPVTQSSNNNFGVTRESWDEEGNARRMEEQQQRDRMEEETNGIEKIEDDLGESGLNPATKDENDEPEKEEQFVSKEDGMATENLNLGKEEMEERAEEMQNEPTTEAEEPNEEEATDQEKEEANADDWNWDDDQEAEEEKAEIGNDHGDEGTDMKQKTDNEGKEGKATVAAAVAEQQQQPTDEWAWGEEDEEAAGEDEDDQPVPASKQKDPQASKASAQTLITSATSQQKQKPDVKQLFENW